MVVSDQASANLERLVELRLGTGEPPQLAIGIADRRPEPGVDQRLVAACLRISDPIARPLSVRPKRPLVYVLFDILV